MCRRDDIVLDRKILVDKSCRVAAVGFDSSNTSRGQKDNFGTFAFEESINRQSVQQIQLGTAPAHDIAEALQPQLPENRAAHQTAMSGDVNTTVFFDCHP